MYRSSRLVTGVCHRLSVAAPLEMTSSVYPKVQCSQLTRRFLTSTPKETAKETIKNEVDTGATYVTGVAGVWKRFIGPKEIPPRWSFSWYGEMALICTVFAITGTSTMLLVGVDSFWCLSLMLCLTNVATSSPWSKVRPAVSHGLGLQGTLKDGPWSYRICSIVIMTPIYSTLLVLVGTVFGRHHYFRHFSVKMFSRFGIPPEMLDANFQQTKKHFRKY